MISKTNFVKRWYDLSFCLLCLLLSLTATTTMLRVFGYISSSSSSSSLIFIASRNRRSFYSTSRYYQVGVLFVMPNSQKKGSSSAWTTNYNKNVFEKSRSHQQFRTTTSMAAVESSNNDVTTTTTATTTTKNKAIKNKNNDDGLMITPALLAQAWTPQIMELEESTSASSKYQIEKATERTLPLLEDVASVPFVCRYRTDIIHPLTTKQVHFLQSLITKHAGLESLRTKLLQHVVPITNEKNKSNIKNNNNSTMDLQRLIQTSTSKTELEDLYAPFKPPSKGSILERIQQSHPELVQAVDTLWEEAKLSTSTSTSSTIQLSKLGPKQELVQLLSTKIAAEPKIGLIVAQEVYKHCRIKTTIVSSTSKDEDSNSNNKNDKNADFKKYLNYDNFTASLAHLKDHQVLAIRRGIAQKVIKMSFDIDGTKMEGCIKYHLRNHNKQHQNQNQEMAMASNMAMAVPSELLHRKHDSLLSESVHDAWTRLLRRRSTNRLWSDKCKDAQERACQVFQQNLRRALLAPPLVPPSPVLSLDPGFQAGIKCAILDSNGAVIKLDTVKFLGGKHRNQNNNDDDNNNSKSDGIKALRMLLEETKHIASSASSEKQSSNVKLIVALGNGHGSQDCRALLLEAWKQQQQRQESQSDINIDIQLVNEAGASVWSVTETAKKEFPNHPASAIAAISIGRRLQNPLFELVKVPPKSLGLGMYQHDISEKELDEQLQFTSIDAVATVGVELNSCSLEILQQVPGLSNKLAESIMEARPLQRRSDLLEKIPRLGAKTFENCAAFCRIQNGPEPLDNTLVHPESYDLARWLLKTFDWKLGENKEKSKTATTTTTNIFPPRNEWNVKWRNEIEKASNKFKVSTDRVLAVIENLIDSMTNVDPRLKETDEGAAATAGATTPGSIESCSILSPELAKNMNTLASSTPVRNIIGTIRNIADFGAFIDFGAENDGLLHTSKLGPLQLSNLLIGQEIGIDILNVNTNDGKISLGLAGLQQQHQIHNNRNHTTTARRKDSKPKSRNSNNHNNNPPRATGAKRSISTTTTTKKGSQTKGRKRQKRD